MSNVPLHTNRLPTPTNEEVAARINEWSKWHPFSVWAFADKSLLKSVVAEVTYLFEVQGEYEERQQKTEETPYRGGSIDDQGIPPPIWSMPVPVPGTFEKASYRFLIPHTDRVETCGGCSGRGRKTCSMCFGRGKMNCSSCGG